MNSSSSREAGGPAWETWFSPLRFGVMLGAFIIAAYPFVVFGDQSFVARDFGLFSYPVALYQRTCFWRGELPMWNPYHSCGLPFLAQFNTLALYPLSLFYLVFPLDWSLSVFGLIHLFIAGMGMYVLARKWTGNNFAASVAGLAFGFNGLALNLLMWPSHVATYAWMPWVVWAASRGVEQGGRALVGGIGFGALQMLAGGPETILLTWMILGAVLMVQYATGGLALVRALRRFFMTVGLVAGICAVQLLPFLALVARSGRDPHYTSDDWATPATGWANLFVPLFGCFLTRNTIYVQDQQYWTSSYYVGIAVLALAVLALWRARSARVWLLAALVALGLLLAEGRNGFLWPALKGIFPFLAAMAHPVKFIFLAVFALPLLAAFGVAEMLRPAGDAGKRRGAHLLLIGAVFGIILAALIFQARMHPQHQEIWTVTLRNGLVRMAMLMLSLGIFYFLLQTKAVKARVVAGFAILFLAWADVRTHAPQQNPGASRGVFAPGLVHLSPQPALGQSRAFVRPAAMKEITMGTSGKAGTDFLLDREALFLDSSLLEDIPTVGGFYSLYSREHDTFETLLAAPREQEPAGLLDFIGVSQETDSGDVFKFDSRDTFMPVFTAGQRPVFLSASNTLDLLISPGFHPREMVCLPLEARARVTVATNAEARVSSVRFSAQRIELDVNASAPALVVGAQSFDPGWQVYAGQKKVPLFRANYGFQAWQVPAGLTHVVLEYRDPWFGRGAWVSAGSGIIAIFVWRRAKGARGVAPGM